MRWRRSRPPGLPEIPEGPSGARLVHPDGSVTELELAYVGVDEEGYNVWVVTAWAREGDQLLVDAMPPRTVLSLWGRRDPQGGDS